MTNNYFKVVTRHEIEGRDIHKAHCVFFDDKMGSAVFAAYSRAQKLARELHRPETSISLYRYVSTRGPWTEGPMVGHPGLEALRKQVSVIKDDMACEEMRSLYQRVANDIQQVLMRGAA